MLYFLLVVEGQGAEEARHRFLRASQALGMLCRNLLPGLELGVDDQIVMV